MTNSGIHSSAYRALTTINAPLPSHIDVNTLVDCLKLQNTDFKWRPHLKSFFLDIHSDIIMDMIIEGTVTFKELDMCIQHWGFEEDENARWIRKMAA